MRKSLTFVLCFFLLGSLAFTQSPTASSGGGKSVKLVYSSTAASSSSHGKAAKVMAEEAKNLSGGRIVIDVHLDGTLFTQEGQISGVRMGTLDMADGSPSWFSELVPSISMFSAAYIFKDYDHMTKVMNGATGKKINASIIEKIGVHPLSAWYMGTRNINLRDIGKVVKVPEDMKGVKLRMANSPSWIAMGKALGANPTPIAISEVYLALKTSAVDGQENPIPTTLLRKFYEVTKYMVLTSHLVDTIMPIINEKKWQSLSKEDQEILIKAAEKGREFCDSENLKIEENGIATLRQNGLTVYEIDKKPWMKYAREYYLGNKDISKTWDLDLLAEISAMVD